MWNVSDFVGGAVMTFGERLKLCREQCGISQRQLAIKSGVNYRSIQGYESNSHDPSLFNISCIATVLGVSIDYLAGLTKYRYPNK